VGQGIEEVNEKTCPRGHKDKITKRKDQNDSTAIGGQGIWRGGRKVFKEKGRVHTTRNRDTPLEVQVQNIIEEFIERTPSSCERSLKPRGMYTMIPRKKIDWRTETSNRKGVSREGSVLVAPLGNKEDGPIKKWRKKN